MSRASTCLWYPFWGASFVSVGFCLSEAVAQFVVEAIRFKSELYEVSIVVCNNNRMSQAEVVTSPMDQYFDENEDDFMMRIVHNSCNGGGVTSCTYGNGGCQPSMDQLDVWTVRNFW
jgi:hypothetical protein